MGERGEDIINRFIVGFDWLLEEEVRFLSLHFGIKLFQALVFVVFSWFCITSVCVLSFPLFLQLIS